jgi:uncharacterized protein involved in exopolysaccharide biosynthesis
VTAPTVVKAGRRDGPREETSLLAFVSILLLHRRVIITCGLAGTALFGAMAATSAERYVSRASFVVRGNNSPVEVPGGNAALRAFAQSSEFSQSVNFYSDLPKAKSIALPVAEKTYTTADGQKKTLAQIYEIEETDPRKATTLAAERLIDDVASTIYSRSGVIGMTVKSTDPAVAQQLAVNILAELNAYGGTRRQQQAVEERRFIEKLLADARGRLDRAEEDLAAFQRSNREYEQSPTRRLAFDRLSRNVNMQQQIYTAMQQAYEQARIEEVRDPSALNIVEPPDVPAEPEREAALRRTLLGLVGGLLVGIVIAFLRQRAAESRIERTSGYLRFSEALRSWEEPRIPAG